MLAVGCSRHMLWQLPAAGGGDKGHHHTDQACFGSTLPPSPPGRLAGEPTDTLNRNSGVEYSTALGVLLAVDGAQQVLRQLPLRHIRACPC
jgi:hypothetical protein